jgi:hypothetical protein
MNRSGNVFEILFADVLKRQVKFANGVFLHACGDADAARLGQAFEPGRDIYPIAENVAVLDNDIALMDADTPSDTAFRRHRRLPRSGATERVDDAGKLGQEAITGGFDDAALMLGELGIDKFASMGSQLPERSGLVLAHEPAIANDIGRQNGR